MSADDTSHETAMNSLGLLTATFHDGYQFGPTTMDYLGAVATDGRQLLRLTNGLTALARVLIMMRAEETGVGPRTPWPSWVGGFRSCHLVPTRPEGCRFQLAVD